MILEHKIDEKLVQSIGRPLTNQCPKIVWGVKKDTLPEKISLINKIIPYSDITIEEERIEEIIKFLFKSNIK